MQTVYEMQLSSFPVNLFYFFKSPVNYTKTVPQYRDDYDDDYYYHN
jgi:hypothetical protein